MKNLFLKSIVLAMILTGFMASCKNSKPVITAEKVDKSKLNKDITVKVGETFTIELASNVTTGYAWQLASKIKPNVVELVSSEYVADENPEMMVGTAGVEKWTFKATDAGEVYLYFKYMRGEELGKDTYYKIIVKE